MINKRKWEARLNVKHRDEDGSLVKRQLGLTQGLMDYVSHFILPNPVAPTLGLGHLIKLQTHWNSDLSIVNYLALWELCL